MVLYLDTETTGLRPGNICQLSYVMQERDKVTAKNFFFTVDFVESGARAVHGFSVEALKKLSGGKRFYERLVEIERDLNSASVVVAHNVSFDIMFLRAEFEKQGVDLPIANEFCTMKRSTPICKLVRSSGGYKYPKLAELCAHLGITDVEIAQTAKMLFGEVCGYHDARFDTAAVFLITNRAIDEQEFCLLKKHI